MRHRIDHRKLGRTTEHRIAMLRNQAISLFKHDRVKTTLEKAKELRRFAEKLITLAKKDTLHARRIAARDVHDPDVLKKLFATLGPLYASRPGGYTRIVKLGFRKGDGAEVALIELVGREPKTEEKPAKGKKVKKTAEEGAPAEEPKKVSPKKRPLASEKGVRPAKAPAKKAKAKAEDAPEEKPEA
jgi:large subunit ribosomal protein L17